MPFELGWASGERTAEVQNAIGAIGAHIVACEQVSGSQLTHNADAYKLGVEFGAITFSVPGVG